MPFVRTLIQSAFLSSAKPERDGWFIPCDERTVAKASGGTPWPGGVDAHLSVRAVYAIVVALVAASCLVGTFSAARDVSWRMGVPHNLWEPALWYAPVASWSWRSCRSRGAGLCWRAESLLDHLR